jgi:hypothetical protein
MKSKKQLSPIKQSEIRKTDSPSQNMKKILPKLPVEKDEINEKIEELKIENGVIKINIKKLIDTIQPILSHPKTPKTPLIIDRSNRTDTFFQYAGEYSGLFIEAKKYLVEVLVKKTMTFVQAMEELRLELVTAMKYGRTLVIRMSDTATDFVHKFTKEDSFPVLDLFVEGGRRMHLEEYWSKVVRKDELEHGTFQVKAGFCVVITTGFLLSDYFGFLSKSLPMDQLVPVYIEPELT